jgi:23S rRNA pseudouridine1911/1915/1917 synthase
MMIDHFQKQEILMSIIHTFTVDNEEKETVLAALRKQLPDTPSWSAVRKLLFGRFVAIGGVLCVDEGRRLFNGEVVTVSNRPESPPPTDKDVVIKYIDKEIVVVEKPSGMVTLRRKPDLAWSWARKNLQPTLDECVPRLIGERAAKKRNKDTVHRLLPKLFPVHRIDRDSSGLLIFARNAESQTHIIQQFAQHNAVRKYFAIVPGAVKPQTVKSQFIRDRGDGLRGSTTDTTIGEEAITHFETLRRVGAYSELECRLETGRTNQIRIHLAELGHPICGDIKYRGALNQPPIVDQSKSRRLALHAAELKIVHPKTKQAMQFNTPWPFDMLKFLHHLQAGE